MVTSPTGDVTQSVAGQALLGARDREPDPAAQAVRLDDAATTLSRINGGAGRAHVREPRVGRVPAVRQPGRDPQVAAAVLPRRGPRPDGHPARRQRVARGRGRGRRAGRRRSSRPSRSRTPTTTTTGARGAAQGPQRLPAGRHADPRRHRRRDHGRDPAAAVRRALAAAAAGRDPRRGHVGVRPGRLPRHPAVGRDHRRPAGDARRRHRLRDPDALAHRGGGGHRPGRPPDPGGRRSTSGRPCWSSRSTPSSPSSPCASPRCR